MKFLIDNIALVLAVVISAGMLLWPALAGGKTGLSVSDAVQHINREKGVLIDVSTPGEFAQSRAKGSRNVPLNTLENLRSCVKNREAPVIFICPHGKRAARAATMAKKMGYVRAMAITGGLKAWREANMPVEQS